MDRAKNQYFSPWNLKYIPRGLFSQSPYRGFYREPLIPRLLAAGSIITIKNKLVI